MARIRRAPKPAVRVKVIKPPVPLHRRILGRGATELDTIADLRSELEKAHDLDQMEYDTYLDCHEALDIREAKAKEALDKATGRYVKPSRTTTLHAKRAPPKKWKRWQLKLLCVIAFLIFWKINIKP